MPATPLPIAPTSDAAPVAVLMVYRLVVPAPSRIVANKVPSGDMSSA